MSDIIHQGINLSSMQRNQEKLQVAVKSLISQNKSLKARNSQLENDIRKLSVEVSKKKDDTTAMFMDEFNKKFKK